MDANYVFVVSLIIGCVLYVAGDITACIIEKIEDARWEHRNRE